MSVKATLNMTLTIEETLDATSVPFGSLGQTKITSNGLNKNIQYTDATDPDVAKAGYDSLPLVAGAASINLAAVAGAQGLVNLTGKKVRAIILRAPDTNVDPIKIAAGAANGYEGFGADFAYTLAPGKQGLLQADDSAVASGARILDVSGTGTDVLDYAIIAGGT